MKTRRRMRTGVAVWIVLALMLGVFDSFALAGGPIQVGRLIGPGPGQDGWSGGAQAGLTNWSAHGDDDGEGEKVRGTVSHAGTQCWHFERGYDSSGQGTPFSPSLAVQAGQPSSGAGADAFTATLWFKACDESGDDSRIMIAGGTPAGTDRSSNYVEIENVSGGGGVTVRSYDGVSGSGWDSSELLVATGLSTTEWHKLEMTGHFTDGTYNDTWTYVVDDTTTVVGGAYFETARDNFGYTYEMTDRLKFQPRHPNYDAAYTGFYFDDVSYAAYNQAAPAVILDSYQTGFEDAAPIGEPGVMGLVGLGLIGLVRRKRS